MNLRRTLITAILTTAILLFGPMQAGVYASADSSELGSLTIVMISKQGVSLTGAGLSIIRVATLKSANGELSYVPTDEFSAANIAMDVNMTAEENIAVSAELTKYSTQNKLISNNVLVGSEGTAVISGLSPGLYLISQNISVEGYRDIKPFMVSLPSIDPDGSTWLYNLIITPKVQGILEANRVPTPTPTPAPTTGTTTSDTSSGSKLPQTGMLRWPVAVLAISGIIAFSLGWADMNAKRKKDE